MSVLYNSNCLYTDKNGYLYSCDNIRLQGLLADDDYNQEDFRRYFDDMKNMRLSDVMTSFTPLKFRYLWNITCKNTTITVMYYFNGLTENEEDRKKVILDFNPNKLVYDDFIEIQKIICNLVELSIVRIDLAIDIPIDRKLVHLLKGNKNYEYRDYNADGITEYTGRRNEPGRCKLYDKTKESKLDTPLTRFEITCKPSMIEFKKKISKVLIEQENYQQELFELDNLKGSTKAVITVLKSLDVQSRLFAIKKFPRYTQRKIRPYALGDTYSLELDDNCVRSVFDWVNNAVYYRSFTLTS